MNNHMKTTKKPIITVKLYLAKKNTENIWKIKKKTLVITWSILPLVSCLWPSHLEQATPPPQRTRPPLRRASCSEDPTFFCGPSMHLDRTGYSSDIGLNTLSTIRQSVFCCRCRTHSWSTASTYRTYSSTNSCESKRAENTVEATH